MKASTVRSPKAEIRNPKAEGRNLRAAGCGLVAVACLLAGLRAPAAESLAEREQKLIGVLESQSPPGEKALACKGLTACGTGKAVPALAPLLLDPDLASWARIALEAIPGPEAEDALSQALAKAQGRLLVGTINSLGVRRDPAPIPELAAKLRDADDDVAAAAAVALGCIGGERAAQALEQALAQSPDAVRPGVAEGCIRCAEKFLDEGKTSEAARLYDTFARPKFPSRKCSRPRAGQSWPERPPACHCSSNN